jgi:hypothetical protein
LRLITPGIYTTYDGKYRVENLRVASGDPIQADQWEVYLQHEPGVTLDTLDQRATAMSVGHDRLDDAIAALCTICGDSQAAACIKECAFTYLPAAFVEAGQLVDLEKDEYADPLSEHRRYEWELIEVMDIERESADCARIGFDGVSVGFPATHLLKVLAQSDATSEAGPGSA